MAALLATGCGPPYRVHKNLQYNAQGQLLDVYVPHGEGPHPAILAFHGGGWSSGSKEMMESFAASMTRAGLIVIAPDYRLAPAAEWPAQLDDARDAVAFVRSAGDALGIDMKRVGVFGISAGGHIASMLVLNDSTLSVVCSVAGESDLSAPQVCASQDQYLAWLLGSDRTSAQLHAASPVAYARPGVRALLIHAKYDQNVYFNQSERLHTALQTAGAHAEFIPLESAAHSDAWEHARGPISAFFNEHLTK